MESIPLFLVFVLAGILAILFAMPFGVFPCKFSDLKGCSFGNGLLVTVLGYSLIIIGIVLWLLSL